MKIQELLNKGFSADEVGFLLASQGKRMLLQQVPVGLAEKTEAAQLAVRRSYSALCPECGELSEFAAPVREFDCDVCQHENREVRPTARLVIDTLVSTNEVVSSVRDLVIDAGLAASSIDVNGQDLTVAGQHLRIEPDGVRMKDVFQALSEGALPVTFITPGPIEDAVQVPAVRFATEFRVLELRNLLEPDGLQDLLASIEPAPPTASQLFHFEQGSPLLQKGYAALFPMSGIQGMVEEMGAYLAAQGDDAKRPRRLFGVSLSPADFCEYWVHFGFKLLGLFAYKLGAIGKETSFGNPDWADGLFFLPKHGDHTELVTFMYDITIGKDYEHELEQAVNYIENYAAALRGQVDLYYVITKREIHEDAADNLNRFWEEKRQTHGIKTRAVYLSLVSMHQALARLIQLPNFFEIPFFVSLGGLLGLSDPIIRSKLKPMLLTDKAVEIWTENLVEQVANGDNGNLREYVKLVRYYARKLGKELKLLSPS